MEQRRAEKQIWHEELMLFLYIHIVKVFKNGPSKICERQPLKNWKWYGRTKGGSMSTVMDRLEFQYFLCIINFLPFLSFRYGKYVMIGLEALTTCFVQTYITHRQEKICKWKRVKHCNAMLVCTSSCWNTSTQSTYIVNFLASGSQCFE